MPKNLTLVVTTPKRLVALPVVIIINLLALKELICLFIYFLVAMRTNLIPSNSMMTLAESTVNHSLKRSSEIQNIKNIQTEHTQIFHHQRM